MSPHLSLYSTSNPSQQKQQRAAHSLVTIEVCGHNTGPLRGAMKFPMNLTPLFLGLAALPVPLQVKFFHPGGGTTTTARGRSDSPMCGTFARIQKTKRKSVSSHIKKKQNRKWLRRVAAHRIKFLRRKRRGGGWGSGELTRNWRAAARFPQETRLGRACPAAPGRGFSGREGQRGHTEGLRAPPARARRRPGSSGPRHRTARNAAALGAPGARRPRRAPRGADTGQSGSRRRRGGPGSPRRCAPARALTTSRRRRPPPPPPRAPLTQSRAPLRPPGAAVVTTHPGSPRRDLREGGARSSPRRRTRSAAARARPLARRPGCTPGRVPATPCVPWAGSCGRTPTGGGRTRAGEQPRRMERRGRCASVTGPAVRGGRGRPRWGGGVGRGKGRGGAWAGPGAHATSAGGVASRRPPPRSRAQAQAQPALSDTPLEGMGAGWDGVVVECLKETVALTTPAVNYGL